MPLNFGALQPIQNNAQPLLGKAPELPQNDADGGIGELFKGLGQLKNALSNNNAPETGPMSGGNLGNTYSTQNPAQQTPNPNQQNQPGGVPSPNIQPTRPEDWYKLAQQHLGQNETKDAPTLMAFFQKSLGQNVDPKTTPWCAAYVNAVLQAGGVKGSGSLAARSLLNWGTPTNQPTPGDVVVLNRGSDPSKGHTGFFAGTNPDGSIRVLGGNQGSDGSVSTETFAPDRVLGYRRPPNGQQIQQSVAPADAHQALPAVMAGIAHVESSGSKDPYSLVGPATKNGDQALGKYQIMQSNLAGWSKEATGKVVTRQEFLQNPQLQEKIAGYQLNKSLKSGYSPQDTASIWFSGRPQNKAGHAKDSFGTTVPQYIHKFNKGVQTFIEPKQQQSLITPKSNSPLNQMISGNPSPAPQPLGPAPSFPPVQSPSGNPGALAMNSRAVLNQGSEIPAAYNLNKPLRDMSPEEIAAIMRWQGRGPLGGLQG